MPKFHKNLTPEKWAKFSKKEQAMMIGSELERAKSYLPRSKGASEGLKKCYERAFELIDLTIKDQKWRQDLKPLLRLREALAYLYTQKNQHIAMCQLIYDRLVNL